MHCVWYRFFHYSDVTMASRITSLTIVHLTVYSGTDQTKQQSSASLAFVRGIHRSPVNCPHKGPVTEKMFPFDDVIMRNGPGGQVSAIHLKIVHPQLRENIATIFQTTFSNAFYGWKMSYFDQNFTEGYSQCLLNNMLSLVQIMAWCRT